jgi:hypothetical protein
MAKLRQPENWTPRTPELQGKWLSIDQLVEPAPTIAPREDDTTFTNPFHPIEKFGMEWAQQGMDSGAILEAAVSLGGLPKGRNGDTNLQHYAEEVHRLHEKQAGGEQ